MLLRISPCATDLPGQQQRCPLDISHNLLRRGGFNESHVLIQIENVRVQRQGNFEGCHRMSAAMHLLTDGC